MGEADQQGDMRRVFRFAPSPNGLLHLGHALSALLNHDLAREADGLLLLRLEDIDRERCREAFVSAIVEDLHWLGVTWAGTPRRQSDRLPVYQAALDELARRDLIFPCFCTRGAVQAASAARALVTGRPRRVKPDGAPLFPGAPSAISRRPSGPGIWPRAGRRCCGSTWNGLWPKCRIGWPGTNTVTGPARATS